MLRALKALKTEYPNGFAECGADALRMTMAAYMEQGRSINMDVNRVVSYRHFCNKLWQASRFTLNPLPRHQFVPSLSSLFETAIEKGHDAFAEQWILSKTIHAIELTNSSLDKKDFSKAAVGIHNFFLHDYCDVFIEFSKENLRSEDPEVVVCLIVCSGDMFFLLLSLLLSISSSENSLVMCYWLFIIYT